MIKKIIFLLFLVFNIPGYGQYAAKPLTVWQVLKNQFSLDHQTHQAEVQKQIEWLVAHPHYLQKIAEQSQPYIYHIVKAVRDRNLPGELALLPMIESAYNPFAYSSAGAAGLWQLMPGTGSGLGLKQDWWFDGRRSVDLSTQAALKYLVYLNQYFKGNWILAIAAYDSGQGKISRAIKNYYQQHQRVNFWSLNLPNETKTYIPRLLAIAEILKRPERYRLELPVIPYEPYFEYIDIGGQIDLNAAAEIAEMSYQELIRLNPAYNRWVTAPDKPHHLLIPKEKAALFKQNLAGLPQHKRTRWQRHKVVKGETLSSIAQQYHSSVELIKHINGLENNNIKINQYVLIPGMNTNSAIKQFKSLEIKGINNSTESKFQRVIHVVQAHENYQEIARIYHVSPSQIRFWNNLPSANYLPKGKALIIWKKNAKKSGSYIIKKNDTLSQIALRYQMTVPNLLKKNPELKKNHIKPGQKIKIA